MRIDQTLVLKGLCESRQEAQECISHGAVFLNGTVVTKQAKQIAEHDVLTVTATRKFVSRGGDKLEGALLHVYGSANIATNTLNHTHVLDIGSSTGGFTDCLLRYGVDTVTAVDVGTSQIHQKLKNDPRVVIFENTDIRNFVSTTLFDSIVGDLSFISLDKLFTKVLSFGRVGASFFLLIKPQFEVGKGNTKKGIVKNEQLVVELLSKYKALAISYGGKDIVLFPCSISGGDGNQEYFLYFTR